MVNKGDHYLTKLTALTRLARQFLLTTYGFDSKWPYLNKSN